MSAPWPECQRDGRVQAPAPAADDAGQSIVSCGLGGTSRESLGNGVVPGSDASTFRPPKATDSITLRGNLDQTAILAAWNEATPAMISNFTTSLIIYDSVGKAIQLDIYFGKDDGESPRPGDSGAWTYHALTDGQDPRAWNDACMHLAEPHFPRPARIPP